MVKYRDRPSGSESKLDTVHDGIKVVKTIATLYAEYRPLGFFGILALLFLALGMAFLVPVLIDYVRTGLVPKFPTFIAAGVFATMSLLPFACGLILNTVAVKHRQLFEVNRNLVRMIHGK